MSAKSLEEAEFQSFSCDVGTTEKNTVDEVTKKKDGAVVATTTTTTTSSNKQRRSIGWIIFGLILLGLLIWLIIWLVNRTKAASAQHQRPQPSVILAGAASPAGLTAAAAALSQDNNNNNANHHNDTQALMTGQQPQELLISVKTKDTHPWKGKGSDLGYLINGTHEGARLNLKRNVPYRFVFADARDAQNHPLYFTTNAAGGGPDPLPMTHRSGEDNSIVVFDDTAPDFFYYQSRSNLYMGGTIFL